MGIVRIIPRSNLSNGIIKFIHKSSNDIIVDVSTIINSYPTHVYNNAVLEDNESYYQSTYIESFITLNFEKYIFISHFAARPRIYNNSAWNGSANISLSG